MKNRTLGSTSIEISEVALGCWPISGMTSLDVNPEDSRNTIRAAMDVGINFFDTAYCYGADGESEKLIGGVLGENRTQVVIATKGGIHWDEDQKRVFDARPERLKLECQRSLSRLNTDYCDLLYLHAPDPSVPLADSAGALLELQHEGKARALGASNLTFEQLKTFHAVCPLSAFQPPYNMLMRDIETEMVPWCLENSISLIVYWPLMKGLLAGRLKRDHVFQPGDGRAKYPMFQGEEWSKNQDLVDDLKEIAGQAGRSVAELVVNWTIHQKGIKSALCGAKRAYQIEETSRAMGWQLSDQQFQLIDQALRRRGVPETMNAV